METQTIEKPRPTVTVMRPPNPNLPATANGSEAKTIEAMPPKEAVSQGAVAIVGRKFPPNMVRALLKITEEVGAIKKEGWNDFQKYNYQKWDDVLNALSPLLVRNSLLITQSQMDSSVSANDALLSITYGFTLIDGQTGECWPLDYRWTGIARLCDGKGVYDDKAANKCATQAHKYFVINLFKIATKESQDDDSDQGERREAREQRKPPNPNGAAQAPHMLPIKEMSAENWAKLYVKNAKTSATVADVKEWRAQNEATLKKLEERFPEVFTDLCAEIDALVGRLPLETVGTAKAEAPATGGGAA
jgi:hypothetical protein